MKTLPRRLSSSPVLILGLLATLLAIPSAAEPNAAETEALYLSGTGYGDEIPWEFKLESRHGRRAGFWTTIPVPSQWQQEGFGAYEYGHDDWKSRDVGHYRHRFQVPEHWRGRRIELVFDGVMTDTEAKIDGRSVGARHQGGFYRFSYDVTALLEAGGEHLLEVEVRQKSKSWSVEAAERDADYWVFGGIYRPVWLRASPAFSIDHVAIDARHEGDLRAWVRLAHLADEVPAGSSLVASVLGDSGAELERFPAAAIAPGEVEGVEMAGRVESIRPWSAETPHLYTLRLDLIVDGEVIHSRRERFGFRTVEIRTGEGGRGLFVNDRRVLLKGVNRHAFWPASGRTLNRRLDRRDAELMKELNLNAVRASHYPPDKSFLEACDELGLYVLNELAGWHDAYGTSVGRRLVRELVERDVNHPSILMWNNGNEDGWNKKLDGEFARHDPQGRHVLHPRGFLSPISSLHYPSWQEWLVALDSEDPGRDPSKEPEGEVFVATEALHGLYDGGIGAGLADFWDELRQSERAFGLFLWSFTDEAIERTDLDRRLDTDGNHAPDGILGPYREPSGNVVAVQQVFSPLGILEESQNQDGSWTLELENRFDHLDLAEVELVWSWGESAGRIPLPAAAPGAAVRVRIPAEIGEPAADLLRLEAFARERRVFERVIPVAAVALPVRAAEPAPDLRIVESEESIRLLAGEDLGVELARDLSRVTLLAPGRRLELGAPELAQAGECLFPSPADAPDFTTWVDAEGAAAELYFGHGCLWRYRWTLLPNGRVRLDWWVRGGDGPLLGIVLPASPDSVEAMTWIGEGPARQWGNRLHGTWGRWSKEKADDPGLRWAHEPKFRGYYRAALVHLEMGDGPLTLELSAPDPREGPFFGLFAPQLPEDSKDALATVHDPDGLAFLHRIPPIGSKQNSVEALVPSRPKAPYSSHAGTVLFSLLDSLED